MRVMLLRCFDISPLYPVTTNLFRNLIHPMITNAFRHAVQSGAFMCLITSDKSRPMCLVVHVFFIEKISAINQGYEITML